MFFDSQIFSTSQLSQLLQVSESTIKRWADGGALKCFKTPGGHRKFRLHDVLDFLDRNGYDALGFLVRPKEEYEDFRIHWQITRGDWSGLSQVCERLLLAGEREHLFVLMSNCVTRQVPLAKVFDLVVMPATSRIKQRWDEGELRVYEEHRATQTLTEVISHLNQVLHKKVKGSGVAVLASPEVESHCVTLAIAALLLEEQGWTVINLGTNTPWVATLECIDDVQPQLVCYGLSAAAQLDEVSRGAKEFAERARRRGCAVYAVGHAFADANRDELGCDVIATTFQDLVTHTAKLLAETAERKKSREVEV